MKEEGVLCDACTALFVRSLLAPGRRVQLAPVNSSARRGARRERTNLKEESMAHTKNCLDENGEWSGSARDDDSGWDCDECGTFIPVEAFADETEARGE